MARNASIDPSISAKLKELYHADESVLSRRVSRWMGKEFSLSIFGLSFKIGGHSEDKTKYDSWIERVNVLEDIIKQNIDNSRYFIIFDELDEDYRNIIEQAQYEQYTSLVTSLFKAIQDVKSIFRDRAHYRIFPIIFLRDDIYEIILDADKNKWNDYKIELSWDADKVKQLVAFALRER
jgi:hypothetical protein